MPRRGARCAIPLVLLVLGACASQFLGACASQKEEYKSGPAFCRSYEDNFLFQCQQQCEGEDRYHEVAAQDTINACKKQCLVDLTDDGQFNSSCPDRVSEIESQN